MTKFLPHNVQVATCDPVIASAMENIDWCAEAESHNCSVVEDETDTLWDTLRLQEPLSSIIANQEIIYNYLQDSFASINKSINDLQSAYASDSSEVVDEKEAQRLKLQAQIEALQDEMNNL